MHVTELLGRLLNISHEWGPHIAIGSFDIKIAFDLMDHEISFDASIFGGVPAHLAAALVLELRHLRAEALIEGVATG